MKIRILKNNPPEGCNASSISNYIGQVLEAYLDENGDIVITEENCGINGAIIFNGEYEIVDNEINNIESTSRKMINEFKNNPTKAIEQLKFCEYECQGGPLINNVAFIALKELIMEDDR